MAVQVRRAEEGADALGAGFILKLRLRVAEVRKDVIVSLHLSERVVAVEKRLLLGRGHREMVKDAAVGIERARREEVVRLAVDGVCQMTSCLFRLHLGSDFRSGALPFPFSRHSISFSLFPIPPVFGPFSLFPQENGFR